MDGQLFVQLVTCQTKRKVGDKRDLHLLWQINNLKLHSTFHSTIEKEKRKYHFFAEYILCRLSINLKMVWSSSFCWGDKAG